MKKSTAFRASNLIAVMAVILVLLLSITSCSFIDSVVSKALGTYSISFDGVEIPIEDVSVKAGEVPIIPTVPEKEGYLGAWTLDGENFDATATFEYGKDITLSASYTPITYKVTFKADGVQVGAPLTYDVENNTVTAPAVPEKPGYTGVWESYVLGEDDVVVNAIYTPITYTATFVADGVVIGTVDFTVADETIAAPAVPEKEGFKGVWESYTIIADNITVNAVYTVKIPEYTVTFVYGGKETSVTVAKDKTVSADIVSLDPNYPFAFIEWQKDGVKFDFETPITEDTTITAVYANEYVFADFETQGGWANSGSTTTHTYITDGAISGSQSIQFTAPAYGAIYKMNVNSGIDLSDVNYVFVKVRVSVNARITFRFVNANASSGTQIQSGYDVKADGGWHTICIDMNSLFTESAAFSKNDIKSLVIMTGAAATITVDDIIFVNDKSLYKQDVIKHYDFENQGGWSVTGNGNTYTYITDGGIDDQSLQATLTAWNGVTNQNSAGLFADTNYIYVKISGVSSNPTVRLYKSIGISNDYYQVSGTTVVTTEDYRIVRYNISDWSALTAKGSANFTKSEVNTFFIGSLASASTFVIDDVIYSATELSFN